MKLSRPRRNRWTEPEDALVRRFYPDYQAMSIHLPRRSLNALRHRCAKLGLPAPRICRTWTAREVKTLLASYNAGASNAELMKLFPGLTLWQIRSKAYDLGARRGRRPLVDIDDATLSSIRIRAFRTKIPFTDLDRMIGSKSYFSKCKRKAVAKHVVGAIELLGGGVAIEWTES